MRRTLLALPLAVGLLLAIDANAATTINFNTKPNDTTYIGSGLLLGSSSGPNAYVIGGCGTGSVGCLGNDSSFTGALTFTFVELNTTNQASTDMVSFIMCRACAFRGSSAQVFDPGGALLATIGMNTDADPLGRKFTYSAASIGKVIVDLGSGSDAVESITFGAISGVGVPEPASMVLLAFGLAGLAVRRRQQHHS